MLAPFRNCMTVAGADLVRDTCVGDEARRDMGVFGGTEPHIMSEVDTSGGQ